jgi:hypothetical protein
MAAPPSPRFRTFFVVRNVDAEGLTTGDRAGVVGDTTTSAWGKRQRILIGRQEWLRVASVKVGRG